MIKIQVGDNHKARRLDRLQSNKHVLSGRGTRRAQYDTHAYFKELARASQADA